VHRCRAFIVIALGPVFGTSFQDQKMPGEHQLFAETSAVFTRARARARYPLRAEKESLMNSDSNFLRGLSV